MFFKWRQNDTANIAGEPTLHSTVPLGTNGSSHSEYVIMRSPKTQGYTLGHFFGHDPKHELHILGNNHKDIPSAQTAAVEDHKLNIANPNRYDKPVQGELFHKAEAKDKKEAPKKKAPSKKNKEESKPKTSKPKAKKEAEKETKAKEEAQKEIIKPKEEAATEAAPKAKATPKTKKPAGEKKPKAKQAFSWLNESKGKSPAALKVKTKGPASKNVVVDPNKAPPKPTIQNTPTSSTPNWMESPNDPFLQAPTGKNVPPRPQVAKPAPADTTPEWMMSPDSKGQLPAKKPVEPWFKSPDPKDKSAPTPLQPRRVSPSSLRVNPATDPNSKPPAWMESPEDPWAMSAPTGQVPIKHPAVTPSAPQTGEEWLKPPYALPPPPPADHDAPDVAPVAPQSTPSVEQNPVEVEGYDYSHLLNPKHKENGVDLRVFHEPGGHKAVISHHGKPVSYMKAKFNPEDGTTTAGAMKLDPRYAGSGHDKIMQQAVFTHGLSRPKTPHTDIKPFKIKPGATFDLNTNNYQTPSSNKKLMSQQAEPAYSEDYVEKKESLNKSQSYSEAITNQENALEDPKVNINEIKQALYKAAKEEIANYTVQLEKLRKAAMDGGAMAPGMMADPGTMNMNEKSMEKVAPPGFDEATMHKLKAKYGVESAFKIAWAAHNKKDNKKDMSKDEDSVSGSTFPKVTGIDAIDADTGGGEAPGKSKEISASGAGGSVKPSVLKSAKGLIKNIKKGMGGGLKPPMAHAGSPTIPSMGGGMGKDEKSMGKTQEPSGTIPEKTISANGEKSWSKGAVIKNLASAPIKSE